MSVPLEFLQDTLQSFRQFRRSPGFAMVSILSLALGIGAATSVFSVIHGALIAPYPYRGADRMVRIRVIGQDGRRNFLLLSSPQFAAFRKLDVLDGAVAMDSWDMASTGDALPEAVHTAQLSPDALDYFGVPTTIGRPFRADAGRSAEDPERVVVLSHAYWQRRYGGSPDAIGKLLQLDHQNYTIIGVLPPRFRWGDGDVYRPLPMSSDPNRFYIVDARLRPGVSPERAASAMQPLFEQFARETPGHFPPGFHVRVTGLADAESGGSRTTLLLLFAAVGVLLAIGCANVSILFLARGAGRLHEFAVRSALGAGRRRLVRQMLTESMWLAAAGGGAGIALALAGLRLVLAWLPKGAFPSEAEIHLSVPVLLFSIGIAAGTGLLFGVAPAFQFSTPKIGHLLRASGRGSTASAGQRRLRDLLVVFQVALTILLLAGAGAAVRGFLKLYRAPLGYDPGHVLNLQIFLPDGNYTTYDSRAAFYRAIEKRVAALPGVVSAGVALFPMPPVEDVRQSVEIMGRPTERGQSVDVQESNGEYFAALRIPLHSGRTWTEAENQRAAHVAVINEEMARRYWPGGDAVGKRFRLPEFQSFSVWVVGAPESNGWLEVIGVVGNSPNRGLREPAAPMAYVPYSLLMGDSMHLIVRTQGAPMTMARAIREQIHAVDAGQPVSRVQTGEEFLREHGWAREQFVASLFLIFAGQALVLAAAGLYSVMAYLAVLRAREFGIRLALGARHTQVAGLVLRAAGRVVGVGVAAGLVLAIAGNRIAARWVAERVDDPGSLGTIVLVLVAAAGVASIVPAVRAAKADPIEVLRAE